MPICQDAHFIATQVYQIADKIVIYNTLGVLIPRQKFCNLNNIFSIFNQNIHYSNPFKPIKEEFVSRLKWTY